MARLRVGGIEAVSPVAQRVRIGGVQAVGPAIVAARLRVGGISAGGALDVRVNAITPITVEPGIEVTVTAELNSGVLADSYAWRQISGPAVTIVGTGASVTFLSPSASDSSLRPISAVVVLGVRATKGGVTSAETTATITALPQTEWTRVHGGRWVGSRKPVVAPPVEGYDIIIAGIQSNMRGAATDYVSSDQYPSNVFMWNHATSQIVPAVEPQSNWDGFNGMGASNTFIKDYAASRLAVGRKVLVVNVTRGGTGFTTPSSNSFGSGYHWRYDLADDANNLARRASAAIKAAIVAAGPNAHLVAFLANHGSTDGTNNTAKATFKGYLQAWITWIRGELSAPTLPYLMMQMRPDLIANETRHRNIADAQAETAAEMTGVGYALSPVGSTYYKADAVHFNAAGARQIGHNLFALLP